jgi:hypothetical protein
MALRPRVEVEIGELVLDGFEPAAGGRFTRTLGRELERLFAGPGAPAEFRSGADVAVLRTTVLASGSGLAPAAVARAVFGVLPR